MTTEQSANFQDRFALEMGQLLTETFESVDGIYLEAGTSLLETLAAVTAKQASRKVSAEGSSVAAHVRHLTFYLELLEGGMRGKETEGADWEETWRITAVTESEWDEMRERLARSYQQFRALLNFPGVWEIGGGGAIAVALAVATHTAYHLGAIRQMLLVTGAEAITTQEG